jgi:uncharacterized protein (DUF983 family)
LFRGWFSMHERCSHCGLKFLREPGYFLGSIYFNYGVTAVLVMAGYLGLYFATNVSPDLLLWVMAAVCVVFPLWFFRYARSLWLGLDLYFDPAKEAGPAGNAPGQGAASREFDRESGPAVGGDRQEVLRPSAAASSRHSE